MLPLMTDFQDPRKSPEIGPRGVLEAEKQPRSGGHAGPGSQPSPARAPGQGSAAR